jgi:hypothetical protein
MIKDIQNLQSKNPKPYLNKGNILTVIYYWKEHSNGSGESASDYIKNNIYTH